MELALKQPCLEELQPKLGSGMRGEGGDPSVAQVYNHVKCISKQQEDGSILSTVKRVQIKEKGSSECFSIKN